MAKILIVDDDPEFRSLVAPLLIKRGHHALEASNGRTATLLVRSEHPDLIVVDGLLPDTDGISWVKRLRQEGAMTPIVFASAYWRDQRALEQLTRELGIAMFARKPVVAHVFAEQLEKQLAASRDASEPALDTTPAADEYLQIREAYGRALPTRATEITIAIERLRKATPGARQEVRALAHRLRGTAGSYGFPAAGDAAGAIEDIIADDSHLLEDSQWSELEHAVQSMAAMAASAAEQSGTLPAEALAAGEKILVVDDDASFLGLVTELARRQATEVLGALNAHTALELAAAERPGAAILDVLLGPSETSFDLARELRAIPGCEQIPIAFISARANPVTRIAAAHAGGSLFLQKPLDATSFAEATQQLLALRPTRPRVLIVDEDQELRVWATTVLGREGMQVESTTEPGDILERLDRLRPDILLLDLLYREISGFDVCRMIRTAPAWRDLPILFLTADTSAETRIAAFQAGGDDYLVKPAVPEELLARVHVRLDRARLMRERADIDALTGIPLRRSFMSQLGGLLAAADRRETSLALCLIDIDHFKFVNDTYGHLSGDRVLSGFGKLLATRFRATDLRSRWGGEEFMLAFPGETGDTVALIAERLLEEVRRLTFESDASGRFGITFSAGVSCYPADGSTVHDLVRAVDRRLYVAKRGGRNRIISQG